MKATKSSFGKPPDVFMFRAVSNHALVRPGYGHPGVAARTLCVGVIPSSGIAVHVLRSEAVQIVDKAATERDAGAHVGDIGARIDGVGRVVCTPTCMTTAHHAQATTSPPPTLVVSHPVGFAEDRVQVVARVAALA